MVSCGLLQLRGKVCRNVVAVGLDGRLDLGSQVGDIVLVFSFFTLKQRGVGFDHGDTLIHARHLVVHVADVLLEDQFRVFGYGNEETDERTDHSG